MAIHRLRHHCLLWPELPASCSPGDRNQTSLRVSLPGEQVAAAQPSVLDPHWNECRRNPLCPVSPHGQQGRSCFCPGGGGSVKVRDELLGAPMCPKGTKVRTAITLSFFSPGDCGVIPGEVGRERVAGGGLAKRAAELLCWACSPPGSFLSFVTALLRYNSHPIYFPCLKDTASGLNEFAELCDCHHSLIPGHCHHPKDPFPFGCQPSPPSPICDITNLSVSVPWEPFLAG